MGKTRNQTGSVKVDDPASTTLKVVMESAAMVNKPITEKSASKRMITQCIYSTFVPQQVICELIGGGVPERYPDLHFALIEFNAHWLASLVGSMDKCWVTGIGQDPDWWLGYWDDTRPADDQPQMAQLFRLNEKWPYPLTPSEYVQRQFHVSFQDDPVAVACRHLTGVSSIILKAGPNEKAQVSLKGKGTELPLPTLPLTRPLTVQFVVNDIGGPSACWEATFTTFQKNDAEQLKAKSD